MTKKGKLWAKTCQTVQVLSQSMWEPVIYFRLADIWGESHNLYIARVHKQGLSKYTALEY